MIIKFIFVSINLLNYFYLIVYMKNIYFTFSWLFIIENEKKKEKFI